MNEWMQTNEQKSNYNLNRSALQLYNVYTVDTWQSSFVSPDVFQHGTPFSVYSWYYNHDIWGRSYTDHTQVNHFSLPFSNMLFVLQLNFSVESCHYWSMTWVSKSSWTILFYNLEYCNLSDNCNEMSPAHAMMYGRVSSWQYRLFGASERENNLTQW